MASENLKRIAKNSFMLYVQMFLSMLVSLYTSRVLLTELGVEDFGIYNVVGGIVAMFIILSGSMTSSSTRYLTFALGKGDLKNFQKIFSTSLLVHLLIAVVIVIIAEPTGIWFMENKMQIADNRMDAATVIFHCSVIITAINIIGVPFSGVIIAHEKISVFTYFSLIDLALKLGLIIFLKTYPGDKLIFYGVLLLAIQVLIQILIITYCYSTFREIKSKLFWDRDLFKEMSSFAGWSLFGDSAFILQNQGINLLINVFFGTTVNAARGVAMQMQGLVIRFISSFQTAINPQITKSYASENFNFMHKLIYASSKFSFYLFLVLSVPILIETEMILSIWLKVVPDYTVGFVRVILLITLINAFANPLIYAVKATGFIRKYEIVVGLISLTIVPISYFLLSKNYPVITVFIVHFIVEVIGQIFRLIIVSPLIKMPIIIYIKEVVINCLLIFAISIVLPILLLLFFEDSFVRLLLVVLSSFLSVLMSSYFFGMNDNERLYLKNIIHSRLGVKN